MKKNILYGLATFSVIALIAGVISYATNTYPRQAPEQQEQVETITATAEKKKACNCCAERMVRLREQIRKARERRQAAQQAEAKAFVKQQKSERVSNSQ